jgi:hypothetical protein
MTLHFYIFNKHSTISSKLLLRTKPMRSGRKSILWKRQGKGSRKHHKALDDGSGDLAAVVAASQVNFRSALYDVAAKLYGHPQRPQNSYFKRVRSSWFLERCFSSGLQAWERAAML